MNIIIGKYFQNDGNVKIYCEKKNVGFLPQNTNFPDDIKVNELIKFVSSYTDTPLSEEEVALILNFSNEQMNKFASKLSGGQQRLLDFCLAVINKPQFLIVDEPTSSMDTSTRHHFWECIQQLKEKGTTVLFTTHYIEEAEHLCHRVGILDKGRLIALETPAVLCQRVGPFVVEWPGEEGLESRFFSERSEAAAFAAQLAGDAVLRQSNLEDVFVEMTGRRVSV